MQAFKILKYEEPPTRCRNIFEQTFKLSYLTLHTLSTSIEKTSTFKNLIDYLIIMYMSTEI